MRRVPRHNRVMRRRVMDRRVVHARTRPRQAALRCVADGEREVERLEGGHVIAPQSCAVLCGS